MGNQEGKLTRNFVSLPPENFPRLRVNGDGEGRLGSDRVVSPLKHMVNTNHAQLSEKHEEDIDKLFLPVYQRHSDIDESHFEETGVIAAGAFGDVVKVIRKQDRVVYAMKIMDKKRLVVDEAVQQSKDEATIQNSVGFHPFIVKPFWFFQNAVNVFIVMEYIPCGELFAQWKQMDRLPESIVQLYIAELAMVLDFLHKSGIIYRDLKMENILIDIQGHLHVTDFGLAKRLKIGQRTGTICGTLQYIAPEVASAQPYGHATDWWSLGILMYALLCGRFPVPRARDHTEMAERMSRKQYELPSSITASAQAQCCLAQLLEKSPHKRLQKLDSLKRQEFFTDIDFDWLYQRRLNPNLSRETSVRRLAEINLTRHSSDNKLREQSDGKEKVPFDYDQFAWNEPIASLGGSQV